MPPTSDAALAELDAAKADAAAIRAPIRVSLREARVKPIEDLHCIFDDDMVACVLSAAPPECHRAKHVPQPY